MQQQQQCLGCMAHSRMNSVVLYTSLHGDDLCSCQLVHSTRQSTGANPIFKIGNEESRNRGIGEWGNREVCESIGAFHNMYSGMSRLDYQP